MLICSALEILPVSFLPKQSLKKTRKVDSREAVCRVYIVIGIASALVGL